MELYDFEKDMAYNEAVDEIAGQLWVEYNPNSLNSILEALGEPDVFTEDDQNRINAHLANHEITEAGRYIITAAIAWWDKFIEEQAVRVYNDKD